MLSFGLPCPPLSVWLLNHMVVPHRRHNLNKYDVWFVTSTRLPNSKVHGANMGPIWGRQDLVGPHVSPMNFAIWAAYLLLWALQCMPDFNMLDTSCTSGDGQGHVITITTIGLSLVFRIQLCETNKQGNKRKPQNGWADFHDIVYIMLT